LFWSNINPYGRFRWTWTPDRTSPLKGPAGRHPKSVL